MGKTGAEFKSIPQMVLDSEVKHLVEDKVKRFNPKSDKVALIDKMINMLLEKQREHME